MKPRSIKYTPRFLRNLKKIPRSELKEVKKREVLFREDIFHPKLKTHKLKGQLSNYWSFSITYSYRIIFRFTDDSEVLFVDIGTHDIYK